MTQPISKIAHDGGDGTILYHCPFCGSGAIVARSDGTTECQSCMTMFTVQVQPQYPMSPQTMQGGDVTPPGMPGNLNDQQEQMGDMQQADEGGMGGDEEMPPGEDGDPEADGQGGFDEDEEEPPEDSAAEGDPDENGSPFPPKKSFITAKGAELTEAQYIKHLAIKIASDKMKILAHFREQ